MFPRAYPHDPVRQLYPDIFIVRGSVRIKPGVRINRNMLILQEGEDLTLINPVRLSSEGLIALDVLGQVKNIVRLGDLHGLDDAFYVDRYGAEFWCQPGQVSYDTPAPAVAILPHTRGPVANSEFFLFDNARYPEAALLVRRHGLLITTDSLQYHSDWRYFSTLSKLAFQLMGFRFGMNVGGPWLKRAAPVSTAVKPDFDRLMLLDFDALVGAHGFHVPHGAKRLVAEEVERLFPAGNH